MARLVLHDHAVERYVERYAPDKSAVLVRERLEAHLHHAARMRTRSLHGQQVWRLEDPFEPGQYLLLVCKPDTSVFNNGGTVCLTILPPGADEYPDADNHDDEMAEEMIAAYRRATAPLPAAAASVSETPIALTVDCEAPSYAAHWSHSGSPANVLYSLCETRNASPPEYIVQITGEAHRPLFTVCCRALGLSVTVCAEGKKKTVQQQAAAALLKKLAEAK